MKDLLTEFFASILNEKKSDGNLVGFGQTSLDGKIIYLYGNPSVPESNRGVDTATHFAKQGETANKQPLTQKDKQKIKSGGAPSKAKPQKSKPVATSANADDAPQKKPEVPFRERQKAAQKTVTELYGKGGKGKLLHESPSSQAALENGYVEGAWWVAPGNAGSNFNENISNEGACILAARPDLSEDELAMILFERTRTTKLGMQQVDSTIKSVERIVIPKEITDKEDKETYKSCVITARSARSKYKRVSAGISEAQRVVGFGKKIKITAAGGTSRKEATPSDVVTDREKILSAIESAPRCFIYDPETKTVYEIPKDVLAQWVNDSGGGENAADTVVFATDENGNLLYDGWSDKKALSDLQANSSLNNDMTRARERISHLSENDLITPKDAKRATTLVEDAQEEISKVERAYKLVAGKNAAYFLAKKKPQRDAIEKEISRNSETAKHYKKFKESVDKVKGGNGKSDAKSVAIAEALSGKSRVKSKEEKQAEKFVADQLELYGEDDIKGFRENPNIPDDVKRQVIKASEAGAEGRKKYMVWFNNEWRKKNKTKLKSQTPFDILCKVANKDIGAVSSDERKVLERTAVRERQRLVDAGKPVPPSLKSVEALSKLRKIALDNQRTVFKSLEKIPAKTNSGQKTTVGALLGFEDAKDALHLDKIDLPKDKSDFKQILKRSTQLVMEGIAVTPSIMKQCLRVKDTQDLQDNFVVGFDDERLITSAENPKVITGKTIALYMVDKDGVRREIAPKVFRSKSGLTGKTQNTLQWADEMQKCFDSHRND